MNHVKNSARKNKPINVSKKKKGIYIPNIFPCF